MLTDHLCSRALIKKEAIICSCLLQIPKGADLQSQGCAFIYKQLTGGLALGQRILLTLLFLHSERHNMVGKKRTWSDEAIRPVAFYQFKAHVIQDN